jgi:hypothetical protein
VQVVAFTGLASLAVALRDLDDTTLVLAVPPGTLVTSTAAARDAYAELDGDVVLAAVAAPRVEPGVAATHPEVSTPYRYIAGDALAGPAGAVRALAAGATRSGGDSTDAAALTACYLAGADVELDVGGALFLVLDGTGTDAVALGGAPYATATQSFPPVVVGDADALDAVHAAMKQESTKDLRRVLGYDGAIAGDDPKARLCAPELLRLPFWTSEFCATIVRAAEATGAWASDDADPVPGLEVPLATISPRLLVAVEDHVGEIVVPALRDCWPEFAWDGLHDAFVIKYVAGGAASLPLHHDVAQISASVRLNDGYAGGALEFPRQGWDNHDVAVGDLIAWPSLVTHPHRACRVEAGVKYGLTLWFALPS